MRSAPASPEHEIDALLDALREFKDVHAIFTGVNADPSRDVIAQRIESYVNTRPRDGTSVRVA